MHCHIVPRPVGGLIPQDKTPRAKHDFLSRGRLWRAERSTLHTHRAGAMYFARSRRVLPTCGCPVAQPWRNGSAPLCRISRGGRLRPSSDRHLSARLFDNPDRVIGEFEVHVGHLVLWHMACRAVVRSHGAHARRMRRSRRCRRVACGASSVVRTRVAHEWCMRIVTCHARQPGIALLPAAAALQAERLRAQRRDAALTCKRDVPERRVAAAAEID